MIEGFIWVLNNALNETLEAISAIREAEAHTITARTLVRTVYGHVNAPEDGLGAEVTELQTRLDMATAEVFKLNEQVADKIAAWIALVQS